MDSDKIIQDLNRRFAAPLPEFYKRRIIVWYDEDREFEDQIADIALPDAKVVAITGSNFFEVKKLIALDDTTSNILLYNPISYDNPDDNWLNDIEMYSEEFRADLISMWMDEMGIPSTPALRKAVKEYRKFFNAKNRRDKLTDQGSGITTPAQIHMAVMAALGNIKNARPDCIIHEVLRLGLDMNNNIIYKEFVNYGAVDAFWGMVAKGTGYVEVDHDLGRLASHILLSAATRTMRMEYFAGLEHFISAPHQAYCYDLVSDWLRADDADVLKEIALKVEDETKLPQRFMKLDISDIYDTEVFPCINEVVLDKLMTEISDQIIDVDVIKATVEKRRICAWYDDVKDYYDGLFQVANMQAFFKDNSAGFHIAESKQLWREYTTNYYKMDTYYRLFHKSYAQSLKVYNAHLQDKFSHVMERVEALYSNWYLGQLGTNWTDACADELKDLGHIKDIPQQTDFYNKKIRNAGSKMFVIISDAFRYEVAASLSEQLRRENQCKVDLSSMQAVFPTITKFGMAALLPHRELTAEIKGTSKTERLAVLADGLSTESNNRENVLKTAEPESVVLKYKDILPMKRAERSALVKGKNVVYIYHDKVDHASHTDETSVFAACDEAIDDIKNIIRIITNEFGGTNIIVTADHGFLYTYKPLTEDAKVDKTSDSDVDVEYGRRYAITQPGAKMDYLIQIKFLNETTLMESWAPRENIRIKMTGAGLNYVHGGISLQEMVVPVVEYHYLRNDSSEYKKNRSKYDTKPVTVSLLSASHKICNMIFNLNFYQVEPVSDNREAATYQLFFTDENGKQISDVQKIIADKTSDNGQERTFRLGFNLKSLQYKNTDTYFLVIADENGLQVSKEEFQIDIAFAVEDFGFSIDDF